MQQSIRRPITDPAQIDHDEFRRMYERGLGCEPIAKKLGCSHACARAVRDQLGLKINKGGTPLTGDELVTVEAAYARYRQGGLSLPQAARLFDISPNRLHAWHVRQHERQRTGETAVEKAAREADQATRRKTERLIALYDRRRELLGGVPWDAIQ